MNDAEMTLQEAIEEVKEHTSAFMEDWDLSDIHDDQPSPVRTAIATILNSVVKGELK